MVLNIAAIVAASCGDMLDLAPIDNYGSTTNGWETIGKKDSHTWRYATKEEIDDIRKRDREVQGITQEDEFLAKESFEIACNNKPNLIQNVLTKQLLNSMQWYLHWY